MVLVGKYRSIIIIGVAQKIKNILLQLLYVLKSSASICELERLPFMVKMRSIRFSQEFDQKIALSLEKELIFEFLCSYAKSCKANL